MNIQNLVFRQIELAAAGQADDARRGLGVQALRGAGGDGRLPRSRAALRRQRLHGRVSRSSSSAATPRCCRSTAAPTRSRSRRSPAACSRRRSHARAARNGLARIRNAPYTRTMRILLLLALLLPLAPRVDAAALLKPGDPFPAWTLRDQTGVKVSSADLADKTYLLWFFPKAMTPGCTAEGRGLRDEVAEFHAHGVEIVGVSFDDPVTNAAFVKEEGFPFRLLSDESHRLARERGRRGFDRRGGRPAHLLPRRTRRQGPARLRRGQSRQPRQGRAGRSRSSLIAGSPITASRR